MKDVLKQIDFGQLNDLTETPKQREAFCSRASSAKPVIENIITRMLRAIGRDYFGNTWTNEQLAYINGMIKFAEDMKTEILSLESEHLGHRKEVEEDEDRTINSGSELNILN